MQSPLIRPLLLTLLLGMFVATALADDQAETRKTADPKAESKKAIDPKAAKAAEKALRIKATGNIESLVEKLNLSSTQQAKVKAFTSETQWDLAVTAFKTSRGEEIHEHAHKIVSQTIPGMMQKFMPGYMRSKIMASRRKARRGPPSKAEIAQIQKDARSKVQPVMRKTVMSSLDELKEERVDELIKDEKTMTRMLADRIIKTESLGKEGTEQFSKSLEKADYPASLTSGADDVLNERTTEMLKDIDLNKIVKAAGL